MKKVLNYFIFTILILNLFFVKSLGVASPYWSDNPLKISPGEKIIFNLSLQNVVGEEDFLIKVSMIDDGQGIAKLIEGEKEYFIPLGSYDTKIPIEINIPKSAGYQKREIIIEFSPASNSKEGMVTLSTDLTQKIPVEIMGTKETVEISETKSMKNSLFFIAIIGIILAGISTLILIRILLKRNEKVNLEYS